jgi:hypothetical protein
MSEFNALTRTRIAERAGGILAACYAASSGLEGVWFEYNIFAGLSSFGINLSVDPVGVDFSGSERDEILRVGGACF